MADTPTTPAPTDIVPHGADMGGERLQGRVRELVLNSRLRDGMQGRLAHRMVHIGHSRLYKPTDDSPGVDLLEVARLQEVTDAVSPDLLLSCAGGMRLGPCSLKLVQPSAILVRGKDPGDLPSGLPPMGTPACS
ncbi:hypothetical protein AB0G86_40195 [Streptomyces scabiei]|uniref:hypothetical protein n=1 Tax=Streptomyces scabiei TaxID=1930 RepID=UPI0033E65B79